MCMLTVTVGPIGGLFYQLLGLIHFDSMCTIACIKFAIVTILGLDRNLSAQPRVPHLAQGIMRCERRELSRDGGWRVRGARHRLERGVAGWCRRSAYAC